MQFREPILVLWTESSSPKKSESLTRPTKQASHTMPFAPCASLTFSKQERRAEAWREDDLKRRIAHIGMLTNLGETPLLREVRA